MIQKDKKKLFTKIKDIFISICFIAKIIDFIKFIKELLD